MARQTAAYVYGNTARQIMGEPLRREEVERGRQVRQRPHPQTRRRARVDKVAVLLTCLTFVTIMTVSYTHLRAHET